MAKTLMPPPKAFPEEKTGVIVFESTAGAFL